MTITVGDFATSNLGAVHTPSWPQSVPIPAHTQGDRLIMLIATDRDPGVTTITDVGSDAWVHRKSVEMAGEASLYVYEIVSRSAASAAATVDVTLGQAEYLATVCVALGGTHATQAMEASPGVTAMTSTPDPDSVTASWGGEETLFIAAVGMDRNNAVTAGPAGYSNFTTSGVAATSGGAIAAAATLLVTSATEDPGVFTATGSDGAASTTLAVRSASAPFLFN